MSPALAAWTATSPCIPAAAASSASCLRDDSITRAPDAAISAAIARPIPLDAPVTSATFPSSRSSMSAGPYRSRSEGPGSVGTVNRLADETSPYLRQHRENPVDWYAWGPEAFARAADEDRPVLLSVGYAACHWCHVMAHECFEDVEVATAMNELFVNVKVDREERPDVDAVYMDAVQALTGQGGWPMTVFLTPDGRPFYGGTYFPKPSFLQLLAAIDDAWRTRRDEVGRERRPARRVARPDRPPGRGARAARRRAPERRPPAARRLVRPGVGRVRPGAQVPPDHEPGAGAPGRAGRRRRRRAAGGHHDARRHGLRRHLRPPRRRVRPLLGRRALAGPPLREDALRPGAAGAALPPRVAGHRRGPLPPGGRGDGRLRARATCATRDGGFYSSEDADSGGRGGPLLPLDPGAGRRRRRAGARAGRARVVRRDRGRQLRGPHHPPPARSAATWSDRPRSSGPGPAVRGPRRAGPARAGRQGPHRVERAHAGGPGRGRRGARPRGLAGRRPGQRRVPAGPPAPARRPLAAVVAGRRRGPPRRPGRRPRRPVEAFVALAQATGEARWIDEARAVADTLLDHFWDVDNGGLFTTADDAEALIVRQKDLLDNATPAANSHGRRPACSAWPRSTGEQRYRHQAEQILQLVGGGRGRRPDGLRAPARRGRPAAAPA